MLSSKCKFKNKISFFKFNSSIIIKLVKFKTFIKDETFNKLTEPRVLENIICKKETINVRKFVNMLDLKLSN